ncbi:hypothetical protein ACFU44_00750 [Nocardia rhizosphaerihabitans]
MTIEELQEKIKWINGDRRVLVRDKFGSLEEAEFVFQHDEDVVIL